MNYRQIISEAWGFTQENKKLIVWYAFIPSILVTLVGILYLLYQFYAFKSSALFENWRESFMTVALREIFRIAQQHIDSLVPVLVFMGILAILYFTLPPIAQGAMVQLIARKKNGHEIRIKDGLSYGFLSFLPLFNYSWVARSFSIVVIGGEIGLVARNLGISALETLSPVFILMVLGSIIFSVLFVFTEYYIIIDDCGVKESMAKSAKLVVKHWDTALMVSILMFLIAVRILVQIIFVLLVPIAILTIIYFIAASSLPFFGLVIGGVIGVIALVFASYLGAIIHVFTNSVWVFTFLGLTNAPELSAREEAAPNPVE